jgi:hypothetical protein
LAFSTASVMFAPSCGNASADPFSTPSPSSPTAPQLPLQRPRHPVPTHPHLRRIPPHLLRPVAYEDTPAFQITRRFLNSPETMLQRLLDESDD